MNDVPDQTLEAFVTRKYNWKGLHPDQQMSMASELLHLRRVVKELGRLAKEFTDEKKTGR